MKTRSIQHRIVQDLIALARERLSGDSGKPRQVILRRAVSDAYYALFHAICYVAADGTVGWGAPWDRFEPLYRSVDHLETKRRLESVEFRKVDPAVRQIGAIFGDLLKERHSADYDPQSFARSKADIILQIDLAEKAIALIEGLPDEIYRKLAVHLIAKPRRS